MEKEDLIKKLEKILESNKDKRIMVIGTTCLGKSTFLKKIKNAKDMDDIVFPLLMKKESDFVCQSPWTEEIGDTMSKLAKEKVKIKKGEPVFGTVVIDSDLIVYLKISDELLAKRARLRKRDFKDAKNMQKQIEKEIKKSKIPVIEFSIN